MKERTWLSILLSYAGPCRGKMAASVALAVGGSAEDPLISKSYIDGEYTTQTLAKAEERIGALDAEMEANACDYEKLNALVADKDAAQAELDALYLRWEELSEAAGEA